MIKSFMWWSVKVEIVGDGGVEILAVAAQGEGGYCIAVVADNGKQLAQDLCAIRKIRARHAMGGMAACGCSLHVRDLVGRAKIRGPGSAP
ncbi:hypothetical protein CR152_32335 (plasmid) [Massilia violaceinigra]|uniref:Uncharacterized protein n=1 Tax=Massilia violaceinigra TaxID=2045208 RepID=A0A2D2DWA2_9BURK|nr:hypothetical protein CR152_32335 [Massilia violaceinigra]